ncbi:class I SAM-dependent methyltransferase [Nonomuraea africana]|uniref:S-adenosyl-L-methionine-dependent methyltransferase n=1 Tax=Nonomuraea africana TaxID=46171 RepID=A0ABR9KPV4_9ACTN|nr:class I SAM-dependent methyltransferase [Nonomuraea africana]MBE1563547.1 methyltransferase (TIGR00027 family) [Nonomuraea africana]
MTPIAFRLVQAVLLPPAVLGYLLWVVKLVLYTRRTGVSATVLASFYTRWMQHKLGVRPDEPCDRLMAVLPNVSRPGLRLATTPTLVAHRLTGHVPRIYRYPHPGAPPIWHQPAARTTFFDEALEPHLGDQVVVLGAGLDTRGYRRRLRCFEIDTPRSQAFKREALRRAGVDPAGVVFVPADFEKDDWFERLVEAGFDPGRPSFFLWESVTMYLDRAAVERTLRTIARIGGVVAFDYLAERSLLIRCARLAVRVVGEPFKFGIDTTRVAAFLESCGLSLEEHRTLGRDPVLAGFAIARGRVTEAG